MEILVAEAASDVIDRRLAARDHAIPNRAFARMLDRWEAPDLREAHTITIVET